MQAPMTIKQYVSQMRKIPGGRFTMGRTYEIDDPEKAFSDELPAHPVDISTFRMGATPVTVGMWREYVRANKRLSMPEAPDWGWCDDHPMINVSWNDIMGTDGNGGYCSWASRIVRLNLSLPTEAMWEYAATEAGKFVFPWGNQFSKQKVWCSSAVAFDANKTAPVVRSWNTFTNKYGLVDMCGNVTNWCFDAFSDYEALKRDRLGYPVVPSNPRVTGFGPMHNRKRRIRGSSWGGNLEVYMRCSARAGLLPSSKSPFNGFRLVAPA